MPAIRKLTTEAADNGLLAPELATGITADRSAPAEKTAIRGAYPLR